MKSFIFTKHYNLPMIVGILVSISGAEYIFQTDRWLHGLIMTVVGATIYFASDRDPSKTVPVAPVPASPPKTIHPSLLPIEWDRAFDEPVAPIPPTFAEALHKPDTRL